MFEELDDNYNVIQRAWPAHTPGFPEQVQTARKIDLRMSAAAVIIQYHDEYINMVRNSVANIILKLDKEVIKEDDSLQKPNELFTSLINGETLDDVIADPLTKEWQTVSTLP